MTDEKDKGLEYAITVRLVYDKLGVKPSDCHISCNPDGGIPLAVAMNATALLAGYTMSIATDVEPNRDESVAWVINNMLAVHLALSAIASPKR